MENNLDKSKSIIAGKKIRIPRGLYPLELEQYELAIEEQASPFEEQAITLHESNLKLMSQGIYNEWIQKSLDKLAEIWPARYGKREETSGIIPSVEIYIFEIDRPEPPAEPVQVSTPDPVAELEPSRTVEPEGVDSTTASEPVGGAGGRIGTVPGSQPIMPAQIEESILTDRSVRR